MPARTKLRARRPGYPLALQLRTAISRKRRLVAAALLSIAATILVLQLAPQERATTPVVVAARPLGAGNVLTKDDVKIVDYPIELVPAAHTPPATQGNEPVPAPENIDKWVGQTLSTAVIEGQVLTPSSVVGPDLLAGQPDGTTAVTIRVADPGALTHLRPGQHVNLVNRTETKTDEPSHTVIAHDVTVLWVADPSTSETGLLSSTSEDSAEDLLVVGADSDTAQKIASKDSQELVPVLVAQNQHNR